MQKVSFITCTNCTKNLSRNMDIYKGAIVTWAIGPWDGLFFCPAPKFGAHNIGFYYHDKILHSGGLNI